MIGFASLLARLCLPLGALFSLITALTPAVGRALPSTNAWTETVRISVVCP